MDSLWIRTHVLAVDSPALSTTELSRDPQISLLYYLTLLTYIHALSQIFRTFFKLRGIL